MAGRQNQRPWRFRRFNGEPWQTPCLLVALSLALELTHALVLGLLAHPLVPSNVLQMFAPAMVVVVSLRQRYLAQGELARRRWLAVAAAFGLWCLAQVYFLVDLLRPAHSQVLSRPDNILWLVYSLPLLLTTAITRERVDRIGWLDRAQAGLFFAVLYLLVFLPSVHFDLNQAYEIQDLALVLCCITRLATCDSRDERRFFVRLLFYLITYRSLALLAISLRPHSHLAGTFQNMVWTLPISAFAVLTLLEERRSLTTRAVTRQLVRAARGTQGASVALLAFLSIAISALLSGKQPLLGGSLVIVAFLLFALRTALRERAWHLDHGRLERTALQDPLTGLGNRMMLRRKLVECLDGQIFAPSLPVLVFVDLDRFKFINDSLGHALGDQLLLAVADRLRTAAPAGAVVCRYGGDEFVLLGAAEDAPAAQVIGESLLAAMRLPFSLRGHSVLCTASIGVVLAADGETADDLLRTADHAMYRAKQSGKNCVQFFDSRLRTEMTHHWRMEADLRHCIQNNCLDVAFQPILAMEGGEISGFEALARWHHPTFGTIAPAEFIPLAEESGLILTLGAQVLEKACRQMALWNRLWQTELSLSVNVSPRQFADPNLVSLILAVLERTGFPGRLLKLEITETSLLANQELARETLLGARTHGIHISLDDFGTGYSSLAFLLNLPVDEVKVDRSFVSEMRHDPNRKELVRAVIQLGQCLGKRVVAEGVETEEDLQELAAMGCESAQGWLIGRPMTAEATEASLADIGPLARRDATAENTKILRAGATPYGAESTAAEKSSAESVIERTLISEAAGLVSSTFL